MMRKYRGLVLGILVFIILLASVGSLYKHLANKYKPDINISQNDQTEDTGGDEQMLQDAPDFKVKDKDGNNVSLSDLRGIPVVINFWASWCGPCQSEMPDFQKVFEKYDGKVAFMMVNMTDGIQETKASAALFIIESGFTFPVYFDEDKNAAYTYSVSSLPSTYFVNTEGKLVAGARGMIDEEILERGIAMIYEQ